MFDDFHVSIAAEELFSIGPLPITNSFLTMVMVMAFLIIGGAVIARRLQDVPGRSQGAAELVVEWLLNLSTIAGGKKLGRQVFPLMASLFIFIIIANYSGLLPGVGSIGTYHVVEEEATTADGALADTAVVDNTTVAQATDPEEGAPVMTTGQDPAAAPIAAEAEGERVLTPWFRPPNADLNMTLALSLISFTVIQVLGVRLSGGIGPRLKHMAEPKLLFPIELVTELSRLISLTVRLFGNVFAGEVLLTLMYTIAGGLRLFIVPFLFPVVFIGLELLFGFIQATVFALLTVIYINLAAGGHGNDDHDTAATNEDVPYPAAGVRPAAQAAD